jgi:hypothetical protein
MSSGLMTDIIADKEKRESQYCSKETEKGFTVCISRIEGHKSKLQYCQGNVQALRQEASTSLS